MRSKKDLFSFLIYVILIIPFLFISSELASGFLTYLKGSKPNIKLIVGRDIDVINGWSHSSIGDLSKNHLMHQHGILKTPYATNRSISSNDIGILITGNSVAMGWPIVFENYEQVFAGQLETILRDEDFNIDIINLSGEGFNSWQEYVEISRYFNSQPLHDDLPNPYFVSSIGGIQDFWSFIDVLNSSNKSMEEYYKSNGLMSWTELQDSVDKLNSINKGNFFKAGKLFLSSSITFWKKNSNLYPYIYSLGKSSKNLEIPKNNDLDSNNIESTIYQNRSLEDVIEQTFNIDIREYNKRRDYVISSVIRNHKSSLSLIGENNFLYVYLPTKFSTLLKNNNFDNLEYNLNNLVTEFDNIKLNAWELYLLEKDYRKHLLKQLALIRGIKLLDLSEKGDATWFVNDFSHFSKKGHTKITQLIVGEMRLMLKSF